MNNFLKCILKLVFLNIKISDNNRRPGNDIHEMGEFVWVENQIPHY